MSNKDEPLIVYKIKEFLSFFVDGTPKAIGHILMTIPLAVQLIYAGLVGLLFGLLFAPIILGLCDLLNCPPNITSNIAWTTACLITLIFYSSKQGELFVGEKHSPQTVTALIIGIIVYIWAK